MVDFALKLLFHNRLRFVASVVGVGFAVMLVLVQAGLFIGILDNATITIRNLDADLWVTSRNAPNIDFVHHFPETRTARVRSTPGVARADNLIVVYSSMSLPTGAEETLIIYALDDFVRWQFPWNVTSGDVTELRSGENLILDESAVRRFGAFRVGDRREVFGHRLKIVGTTADARSFTTTPLGFMDYDRAQRLNPQQLGGNTSYILVQLEPDADPERVRAELRRRLPNNDIHTSIEWQSLCRGYWIKNTGLGFNAILTVFLACLIATVIVAQTLYASTLENLEQFGVVKAIGGRNTDIYRLLMKQAVVTASYGFVVGYVPAQLLVPVVARAHLKMFLPASLVVVTLVATQLLCAAAALASFRRIANVDPGLVFRG